MVFTTWSRSQVAVVTERRSPMRVETPEPVGELLDVDDDAQHLASLGYSYERQFKREMTFWGNVSLGFTYLSPVVAIYSLFAASLSVAGPPMFWSLVIVG